MKIVKTPKYKRDLKTKIVRKHMGKELERIELIENLLMNTSNMKTLSLNPLSKTYSIQKKKNDLKNIYTARINQKIRMYIKPIGEYPYNLEEIIEVELVEIDNQHYGDG